MSNEKALLQCTFGWGKTCCLYLDVIEIADKSYNLHDLISVHPSYRRVLGVPSARLELLFGQDRVVLRGIPDLETVRLMVSHLQPYCSAQPRDERVRPRSTRNRDLARAQARVWERTSKLPTMPTRPQESPFPRRTAGALKRSHTLAFPLSESLAFQPSFDDPSLAEVLFPCHDTPEESLFTSSETLKSPAQISSELTTHASPWLASHLGPLHMPRLQPPLHSVHLIPPGQKTLDSCSMPVPAIKSSALPIIHVPVRLQPGECAHYSTGATLCSDRISGSDRAPYPPLDHGLLILTNRRLFYIGKRSQLILPYTYLWYVSLLHNAIALHIERQFRRIIIELEHPQEWASRVEQLSFIARRAHPQPELPTLLMSALPGLQLAPLNAATLKRPAIKVQTDRDQRISLDTRTPLLAERIESKIVDAQTIALNEQRDRWREDGEAPASLSQPDPADMVRDAAPEPTPGNTPVQYVLPPQPVPGGIVAQDLLLQAPLGEIATQELLFLSACGAEEAETTELDMSGSLRPWDEWNYEEIDTLPLRGRSDQDDRDEQTICLGKRQISQARTNSYGAPVSDQLPTLEITPRCISRVHAPRSSVKEERSG